MPSRTREPVPFFSPLLGWLGVFLTRSDTSSCACSAGCEGYRHGGGHVPSLPWPPTSGGVTAR
ncbi:MAG: hypothetical protein ACLR7Z_01210 [Bilophila wadsworthia]